MAWRDWQHRLFRAFPILATGSLTLTLALPAPASGATPRPVLKWQRGGAYSSWAEIGWYSSPAVADLDGDGKAEVIGANYSVFALDGTTGALKWRAQAGHDVTQPTAATVGRTWPGVVVTDLDGNGSLESVEPSCKAFQDFLVGRENDPKSWRDDRSALRGGTRHLNLL